MNSSKSRLTFVLVSLLIVVPLLAGAWTGPRGRDDDSTDDFYKYLSVFTDVMSLVRRAYVEEPDYRSLMAGALDGATDSLDPFSVFVPAPEADAYREARAIGRAHSGVEVVKERGVAYVLVVEKGSPGELAGFERGDILAMIDGRSSRAMPLWEIRKILAAPEGTRVPVEIVRRGESLELEVELAKYEHAASALSVRDELGVLRVPSLSSDHVATAARLLSEYEGEDLLLDLRGVAGGSAEASAQLADAFLEDGEITQLVGREGSRATLAAQAGVAYSGKLAVLVDRASQGPAEILAAALRESTGALLIGEPTFGYAGTTKFVVLRSGGLLEITDAFYTGPDGEPLDESLEPDHRLRVFIDSEDGDDEDPVLDRAIEVLREARADEAEEAEEAA